VSVVCFLPQMDSPTGWCIHQVEIGNPETVSTNQIQTKKPIVKTIGFKIGVINNLFVENLVPVQFISELVNFRI